MKLSLPTEVQTPTCPVIADTSVLKTIGNTPLIRIKNIGNEFKDVTIFAKAEWKNAGGSVKSRPALRMIEDGEKSGKLTKNKIILDNVVVISRYSNILLALYIDWLGVVSKNL